MKSRWGRLATWGTSRSEDRDGEINAEKRESLKAIGGATAGVLGIGAGNSDSSNTGSEQTNNSEPAKNIGRTLKEDPKQDLEQLAQNNLESNSPQYQGHPERTGTNPGATVPTQNIQKKSFDLSDNIIFDEVAVMDDIFATGSRDGNIDIVDHKNGRKLDEFSIGGPIESTPAISDGVVYGSNFKGEYVAIDIANGTEIFSKDLPGGDGIGSPIVDIDGKSWVNSTNKLFGFDENGNQMFSEWIEVNSNGIALDSTDNRLVASSDDGHAYILDAETGDEIFKKSIGSTTVKGSPAVKDGTAYIETRDALEIIDLDEESKTTIDKEHTGGGRYSPVVVDDKVIVSDYDGIHAYDTDGQLQWSRDTDSSRASFSMASDGDTLVAANQDLVAFDVDTGSRVWKESKDDLSGAVYSSVSMGEDAVFAARNDGNVDKITGDAPNPNQDPLADADYSPLDPEEGKNITLDASASSDPDGNIDKYLWDINGDGQIEKRGEQVQHAFQQEGTYTLELTVHDNDGATDTETLNIDVEDAGGSCDNLGNTSQQYDQNNNCKISIGELGNAASDYTSNQLEISELAQVARDYARTV